MHGVWGVGVEEGGSPGWCRVQLCIQGAFPSRKKLSLASRWVFGQRLRPSAAAPPNANTPCFNARRARAGVFV